MEAKKNDLLFCVSKSDAVVKGRVPILRQVRAAMVEFQELHNQLKAERELKQRAVDSVRQLQRDVDQLKHDATRRENELETALLALSVYEEEIDVHDLVEHNIALREQVQSLKATFEQIQLSADTSTQHSVGEQNDRSVPGALKSRENSNRELEDKLRSASSDVASVSPEQLITRNEVQQLLAKLAAKESQLQLLHERCASWEQQVIELKFEMQTIKHAAKEQEEVARVAQHSIIRQECCAVCKSQTPGNLMRIMNAEKKALMAAISPKAPRTDLEHYKSLAQLRGVFWLQALEKVESLSAKVVVERCENAESRKRMEEMELQHRSRAEKVDTLRCSLENAVSCCDLLETQLAKASQDAERAIEKVDTLQMELDSEKCQRKTDKIRSARIILDLRGELNHQLMELEQLHVASLVFSPKNSRGIDSKRRSFVHVYPAA